MDRMRAFSILLLSLLLGIVAKLIEIAQSMKLLETRGQLGASMTA